MRRPLLRLLLPAFSLSLLFLAIAGTNTTAAIGCNNKVCVLWEEGSECLPQINGPEGVHTHCLTRRLEPTRCVWEYCDPQ